MNSLGSEVLEPKLECRAMSHADWPLVQAGFAHSFLKCHTPETWAWKFRTHDERGWRGWITQEKRTRAVVAFLGGVVHAAQLGDKSVSIILPSDSYSHPDWRSGGKHAPFILNETAFHTHQSEFAALSLGFGLDRRMQLAFRLQRNSHPFVGGAWMQFLPTRGLPPRGCSIQLTSTDFGESQWNAFWQQRSRRVALSLIRDQAFLSWRFDSRQGHRYHRFAIRSATSLVPLGYVVLKLIDADNAVMVDSAFPTMLQQQRDTWNALTGWLNQRGIKRMITFISRACPELQSLKDFGWADCAAPMPVLPGFVLYAMHLSQDEINHKYAMTLADSDLY